MALKDKVADAQATTNVTEATPATAKATKTATATATAPAPTPVSAADKSNTRTAAFKQHGASLRAQMTEDQKAMEGSKSDKVTFICALGDPNRKQARRAGKESIPSFTVVGYKFKVLEDMTVPFAPIAKDYKTPLDVEPATEKQVKAGEVVALNLVETAMFISRVEFAGKFSGEGVVVGLSAKTARDRKEPLPILFKLGAGSVKENMEFIADMVGQTADSKGTPKCKEDYEPNFGALYAKKSLKKKSAGTSKSAGEGQADIAAAFRSYYAGK